MRKSTSRLLYLISVGLSILCFFIVWLVALLSDPAFPTVEPSLGATVGIVMLGLLSIIFTSSAWIGALIRTAHLKRWGWFMSLLLIPGLTLLFYIFGGPDFYLSNVALTEIMKKSIACPFCKQPHAAAKISRLADEGIRERRQVPGSWIYPGPRTPYWSPPGVQECEALSLRAKYWRSVRPSFAIFTKWNQLYYCEQCNIVFNPATHEKADPQHIRKLL